MIITLLIVAPKEGSTLRVEDQIVDSFTVPTDPEAPRVCYYGGIMYAYAYSRHVAPPNQGVAPTTEHLYRQTSAMMLDGCKPNAKP